MLDCNTPAGREAIRHQHEAARLFCRRFPGWQAFHTRDDSSADLDWILVDRGVVARVAEVKSRSESTQVFFGPYKGEWLITKDKIDRCVAVSSALMVPLVGVLYLFNDHRLIVHQLWHPMKGIAEHVAEESWTQATVNGGRVLRKNMKFKLRDRGWVPPEHQTQREWIADYERAEE